MIPKREMELAMRVKSSLVHDTGQRADLSPIVVHHHHGEHVATLHACGPSEQPETRLPLLSTRLACAGFDTDELVVTADAHVRDNADPVLAAETEPGDLAREYADDPSTDVTEALVSTYVRRGSDEATMLVVPYHYTDHGGVIEVEYGEMTGPMAQAGDAAEALVAAVNMGNDDPARELWAAVGSEVEPTHHVIAQALVAMFDHGVMVFGGER